MNVTYELWIASSDRPVQVSLPAHYEVCSRCQGQGSHVNPSIDGDAGLGAEAFEDDDFREMYFSGGYDVTCYECKGERVVPAIDIEKLSKRDQAKLALLERQWREEASDRALQRAEIMMGA